ncbi:unnamed protein product [Ectocarpus sp. 12 AP-2014]
MRKQNRFGQRRASRRLGRTKFTPIGFPPPIYALRRLSLARDKVDYCSGSSLQTPAQVDTTNFFTVWRPSTLHTLSAATQRSRPTGLCILPVYEATTAVGKSLSAAKTGVKAGARHGKQWI